MKSLAIILAVFYIFGFASTTDCPNKWIAFDGHCYLFGHSGRYDFFEAENFCKSNGGHLVHVDSALENTFIRSELRYLRDNNYWMGLTDYVQEGNWVFYDTNKTRTFAGWGPGEPNSYHGEEDCASFLDTIDYQWSDVGCMAQFEPVCEISVSGGVDLLVG